ncbi:MAG: M23 family metallopeptidase [Ruminococcus sp.]|nr:M23 family metallopeptidase [Ruminococcus sp.]
MKLKKIAAVLMSMTLALSMAQTVSAVNGADYLQSEPLIIPPQDNYAEYEEPIDGQYFSVENVDEVVDIAPLGIEPYSTNSKTYGVTWTVKAGTSVRASIKTYMSTGDKMTFNLSYTPTTANVGIGVVTPSNVFRNYSVSNGRLSATMTMNENGIYQMCIKNSSKSDVKFSGTYSFNATCPFEYMFKSPKMATYISSKYGEVRSDGTHYALDITTGVAGGIQNYPVYNTLTGTVIKNGYFTDGVTTCVAITHTNGYTSRFLHMDLSNNGLSLNGSASTGKQIGKVSNKGCSAYHLHLDVNTINTYNGPSLTSSNTVNPQLLFPNVSFT